MEIKDIQNLIKFVAKSGAQEVKLEMEDIKITIKTPSAYSSAAEPQALPPMPTAVPQIVSPPPPVQDTPATPEAAPTSEEKDNLVTITSPIIGTFYRKPSPDKPLFVEVGDVIKPGDVLCVIEAMKLFNEIESEVSGKVVKILLDDASPVEFEQPLFVIDPS